jgi:hypothetical protein
MDFRRQVWFCLALLALCAGCRQNNAHRELLERELRFQEDRIYELEAELETARRELSRYCATPSNPGFAPPGISTYDDAPPSTELRNERTESSSKANPYAPPAVELPAPTTTKKEAAPPFTVPPVILPPDPNVPEGLPSRSVTPGASSPSTPDVPAAPPATEPKGTEPKGPVLKTMSSPKFLSPSQRLRIPAESNGADTLPPEPVPQGVPSAGAATNNAPSNPTVLPKIAAVPLPSDDRVTSLNFGKRTGGMNNDGRLGDEGVLVLLELRSGRGEVIAGNGDLSIALIDPAVEGEGGRYARWDFTGSDVAALFRQASTEGPTGTYLELAWPDAPPQHARLKLFVRLRTPDGRQLQIDRDVTVELPLGATSIAPPAPFMPTLAPPRVTPVAAPAPDEHDPNAAAKLNWGKRSAVQPAILSPEPGALPSQPAPAGGSVYEAVPIEGPSLGPALIPAAPR